MTGMMCAIERASFFFKMPLAVTLIVNYGSLTFLIFIFKSLPGNYWTTVLLVSPKYTLTHVLQTSSSKWVFSRLPSGYL